MIKSKTVKGIEKLLTKKYIIYMVNLVGLKAFIEAEKRLLEYSIRSAYKEFKKIKK